MCLFLSHGGGISCGKQSPHQPASATKCNKFAIKYIQMILFYYSYYLNLATSPREQQKCEASGTVLTKVARHVCVKKIPMKTTTLRHLHLLLCSLFSPLSSSSFSSPPVKYCLLASGPGDQDQVRPCLRALLGGRRGEKKP